MAKIGYKYSGKWIEHIGESALKLVLDEVSDNSTAVIANLYKNQTKFIGYASHKLNGGWDAIRIKGSRNGMKFENVQVSNGRSYIKSLGKDPDNLTKTDKADIGETFWNVEWSQMYLL